MTCVSVKLNNMDAFEQLRKSTQELKEVREATQPIISSFVDTVHNLVGASETDGNEILGGEVKSKKRSMYIRALLFPF